MGFRLLLFFLALSALLGAIHASAGDADPVYRSCVEQCEKTGCVGDKCFQHCNFSAGNPMGDSWYLQEPLYVRWKRWDCQSDCRYQCMLSREEERKELGYQPVKYHGKWPFHRVYGIQEPVSVALSVLNLAIQFHGWVSFFILVNYKLPFRPNKKTYYEYTGLCNMYAVLAMNAWFWSAVFHSRCQETLRYLTPNADVKLHSCPISAFFRPGARWDIYVARDVDLTEKLDYSSAVALLGYSLLLAILRVFNVTVEAVRVMVSAPILAFVTTHILYLNFYDLDYGLNMKVCVVMGITQLVLWAVWAGTSRHPARWKLLGVVIGGAAAMLLEIYDFPPFWGFVDAHALWHATTIPLTYLWWSFLRDDSEFRTSTLMKKIK